MSKLLKVSILCLTHNHEKFIRQALDSFVAQKTDFDFEILIHDDASTDGTQEIIKEYEKNYRQNNLLLRDVDGVPIFVKNYKPIKMGKKN